MGYQFAHFYTYSGTGGKAGDFKVSGCLGEAFRDDGHTKHIENPAAPGLIYGERESIEKAVQTYQDGFKDARGHKLRKDGKCLLAGVFSWPPGTKKEGFEAGNSELLTWLQNEYGSALRCVVTHEDEPFQRGDNKGEPHLHCHFFVVPNPSQNMKVLHPGLKAKAEARAAGKNLLEQDRAYKEAMGDWQDKIHRELGERLGFARARPEELQERRLSRREQKVLEAAEEQGREREKEIVAEAESQSKSVLQYAVRMQKEAENFQDEALQEKKEAQKKTAELNERERLMDEARKTKLTEAKMPGVEKGEYIKNVPLIGPVFKATYFDRVREWASGLAERALKIIKENNEQKDELQKERTEVRTQLKRVDRAMARLEGKYGEENEFEEYKRNRDTWRAAQGRPGPSQGQGGPRR